MKQVVTVSLVPLLLQALGSFYFVHDSIEQAEVWDFKGRPTERQLQVMRSHWLAQVCLCFEFVTCQPTPLCL